MRLAAAPLAIRDCIAVVSRRREELRALFVRTHQFVLAAAAVGAITGIAVAGFERLTVEVVFDHGVAKLPLWLLAFAPGIGLAIATLWLRRPGGDLSSSTADERTAPVR